MQYTQNWYLFSFTHRRLLSVDDEAAVELGLVEEVAHVLPVLGHDELDGVLVLFKRRAQLLVLLLQRADVPILLLYAYNNQKEMSILTCGDNVINRNVHLMI